MSSQKTIDGITLSAELNNDFKSILTPGALTFIADLCSEFEQKRLSLLNDRNKVQESINNGTLPDFLPETQSVRDSEWSIAPVPHDLQDRRVEVTGPVDRKMVINALNSGAKCFMADFEDSHSPTWNGTLQGQINLRDAVNGTIEFTSPEGRHYKLNDTTATLIVRPRGWHLVEKHVLLDGSPVSASIFDFALYLYHNGKNLINKGSGPYFYLPKIESYHEAGLWNAIFIRAQEYLDIPYGTIKATVLIETLPAAFQMDEIIYELKDHMAGLNCGRWDYIFSFIKRFNSVKGYLFPDRSQITMSRHCMRSYSLLAIKTCHRRGAHAMGGMAAQIPVRDNPEINEAAFAKVREDKAREAADGHDGTWVAHPGLVPVAMEQFDKIMPGKNQIENTRSDISITAKDLLKLPEGTITEKGLRANISIGIQYMASWLSGNGCVPLNNLMEDAATAEISRTQVWQWIHNPEAVLDDGRSVTLEMVRAMISDEVDKIIAEKDNKHITPEHYQTAERLFETIVTSQSLEDFLTIKAYEHLD